MLRSIWGAVLLARPRRVGDALGLELSDNAPGRGVMRVLGGRHLGQAAVTAVRPSGTVVAAGAGVDGLHALTALGWGLADRSHRRAGLTDAGLAAGFGIFGALVARGLLMRRTTGGPAPAPVRRALPDAAGDAGTTATVRWASGAPTTPDDPAPRTGTPAVPTPRRGGSGDEAERKDEAMPDHKTQQDKTQQHADQTDRDSGRPEARVRPRLMWVGVAISLLAMFGIGAAMIADSGAGEVAGVVALLVGALLAWRGGVLNDVQSSQPMEKEVEAAVHGREHSGVVPGEQLRDPEAEARAAAITHRKQALLRSRVEAPGPPMRPVATLGLLLLGAWLFIGTFVLPYYYTVTGVNSVERALGGAVVVTLCALWLRHVGPNLFAAGLAALAGVLLVLAAFLAPHTSIWVNLQEAGSGSLVVLAAALAAGSRRPR